MQDHVAAHRRASPLGGGELRHAREGIEILRLKIYKQGMVLVNAGLWFLFF